MAAQGREPGGMPPVQITRLGKGTKKGGESMTRQEIIDGCKSDDPPIRAYWPAGFRDGPADILREMLAEAEGK
jgi:hypothetical protein